MKQVLFILLLYCCGSIDLMAQMEGKTFVQGLFHGTRVVNGHSAETLNEGELDVLISHRFGRLNGGAYELFGLDQASIRLGLEYGFKNWLMVGFGRSSFGKHFDGFLKLRLLRQSTGKSSAPLSITAFMSSSINSLKAPSPEEPVLFQSRLAHTAQLLIARKFGNRLSLQLMPSLVHYNLVESRENPNDLLALGGAGRYQLSKNLALTMEYYHTLPGQLGPDKHNSFSVGIDLNTGSHVFQLHFTNSNGMIEKIFIGETTGDWMKGDIHFGFNMSRTFKVKGRRY